MKYAIDHLLKIHLDINTTLLLRKKNDKSLFIKYTFNNINLDEVDKTLNDYMTTHNAKLYFLKLIVNL